MAPIKLLKILLSLICSAAAQALVFDQPEYSGPPQTISHGAYLSRVAAPACEPTDMAILHAGVTQVENFCHFYLSQTRVSSPVPALEPTTLTKLCRCTLPDILTKRTADVSKTSLQRPVTCRYPALEGIEAQYRDPRAFCAFWDTLNHSTEIKQAVPSVSSNVNVQKGCECLKPRHHWKHVPGKSVVTSASTATTDGPSTL